MHIADKRIYFLFDAIAVTNITAWNISKEMPISVQRQMPTIILLLYVRNVINLFNYFQMLTQAS